MVTHPNDPRLVFEAELHEEQPASNSTWKDGGSPSVEAYHEIIAVGWIDNETTCDITNFVVEYAPELFRKWEKELDETLV